MSCRCGRSSGFALLGAACVLGSALLVEALDERAPAPDPHADRVHVSAESDAAAIALAQSTVRRMGGWEAWDAVRIVRWDFFGGRRLYWNKPTGEVRIETEDATILLDLDGDFGRATRDGAELEGAALAEAVEQGRQIWVNDAYWMFMPYKMLDPGVTLKSGGERELEDGRVADVVVLTFEGVGYTPENRYDVWIARDSGLVERWDYFTKSTDAEPRISSPWNAWKRFGGILLATDHGRGRDWNIAVLDALPDGAFRDPAPIPGAPPKAGE